MEVLVWNSDCFTKVNTRGGNLSIFLISSEKALHVVCFTNQKWRITEN